MFYSNPTRSAFIIAVLQNAHDLVTDAEALLDRGRWARAHALATLAMEEAGKASLADRHFEFSPDEALPRRGWGHHAKLTAARQMAAFVGMVEAGGPVDVEEWFSEEHDALAEDDFYTRMTGLYVDLADGEVVGGSSAVTQARAEATCALAGPLVHHALTLLWAKYSEALGERTDGDAALE